MPVQSIQTVDTPPYETVAVVDLGSNSFHMIVARIHDGHMQIIDRLREMVRLAEGLNDDRTLQPEVIERALSCLERFGQRLREFALGNVRVVGTNTLRQMRDGTGFIERAEAALGHPIAIISGREEARLIYLGVAHGLAPGADRRLVVDIGGGSTEIIVGFGFAPRLRESLSIGCVSMSRKHFADGKISTRTFAKAALAGALEIRPVRELFCRVGWHKVVGSSGTIRSIAAVLQAEGLCEEGISAVALDQLQTALLNAGKISALDFKGLTEERRSVFIGGFAVLRAIFNALSISHMQVSDYALREGLIYEMMGRHHHEDVREQTVAALCKQFQVDQAHAQRVQATATAIYNQLIPTWLPSFNPDFPRFLAWAARLHEIGLLVSHSQYQKHGAYLLRNADLAGFTRQEQALLAALVLGHRRKFPLQEFNELPQKIRHTAIQLCIILRLAVLLHRGRSILNTFSPIVSITGDILNFSFPADWLARHPLTQLELEQEAERLTMAGIRLIFT